MDKTTQPINDSPIENSTSPKVAAIKAHTRQINPRNYTDETIAKAIIDISNGEDIEAVAKSIFMMLKLNYNFIKKEKNL